MKAQLSYTEAPRCDWMDGESHGFNMSEACSFIWADLLTGMEKIHNDSADDPH